MIIFLGVAGSGKSVQGRLLADVRGYPWLSTGEFLRMLISGDRRKEMLAGELLSDKEMIALVKKIFNVIDTREEFVLDGFPRTVKQAEWLLSEVEHGQLYVTAVFHLKADQTVVKKRLMSRGRPDDHAKAIAKRFTEYKRTTLPILKRFRDEGIPVFDVEAERSVERVHKQIIEQLTQYVH